VEALAARRGKQAVVSGCIDLLAGRRVEPELVAALGGPPARWVLDGGAAGPEYWLRVWALRGLLWLWDDTALSAVLGGLADPAWRAREMAAKVCARHQLDDALPALLALRDDPIARVRAAASRAVIRLSMQ
jgi:HEAT repeat protein